MGPGRGCRPTLQPRPERALWSNRPSMPGNQGRSRALRQARARDPALHRHAFASGPRGAAGPRGLPNRVRAAASPRCARLCKAALALRVRGLIDEGQVLARIIQGGRRGRGRRLGLLRGRRGRGLCGTERRRQRWPLLLQRRRWLWGGGSGALGHPRRHCAGPAGSLRRKAAHLCGEEQQPLPRDSGSHRSPLQPA